MREHPREPSSVSTIPGLTSHNAPRQEGFVQMHLCTACLKIGGPWREYGDPQRLLLHQVCLCERQRDAGSDASAPDRWPGFDLNEAVTLCYCCGIELLNSGSKFSQWFCDDCKQRVLRVNEELRFYLIPIGRHSLMAGLRLNNRQEIEAFVQRWGGVVERMHLLDQWSLSVRRESVEMLGQGLQTVTLPDYLAFPWDVVQTKLTRFRGLCRFFSIEL